MNNKKLKYVYLVLITVSLLVCFFSVKSLIVSSEKYKKIIEGKTIELEKQSYLERIEVDKNKIVEKNRAKQLNFYQKLQENIAINVLVVGNTDYNEIEQSSRVMNWLNKFNLDFKSKYKSILNFDFYDLGGASIARACTDLFYEVNIENYDIILIDELVNSEMQLTYDEYEQLYSSMIYRVLSLNDNLEIFSLYDSSRISNSQYIDIFQKVNDTYSIEKFNTRNLDENHISKMIIDKIDESLTSKVVLPNLHFANDIQNKINKNPEKLNPINISNIGRQNDFYYTESELSIIDFKTEKNCVVLNYFAEDCGGIINVYINDKLTKEVNTKSEYFMSKSIVIADWKGMKDIRLEMVTNMRKEEIIIIYDLYGL